VEDRNTLVESRRSPPKAEAKWYIVLTFFCIKIQNMKGEGAELT